jgi:hypothetical protein
MRGNAICAAVDSGKGKYGMVALKARSPVIPETSMQRTSRSSTGVSRAAADSDVSAFRVLSSLVSRIIGIIEPV